MGRPTFSSQKVTADPVPRTLSAGEKIKRHDVSGIDSTYVFR
jgi:hypothetical protein